ncbi:kinase-like domain-containing protein [Leptodontidium sp. 2 PMI_412]|nr:kinase-like domain-containing protein [Leptodontidium sp. 2 PMI_412]
MGVTQVVTKYHWKPSFDKDSFDSYDARCLGKGSSGSVFEINQDLVIKIFSEDQDGQEDFDRERSIFAELQSQGPSEYVINFVETWDNGLVLERLSGTIRSCLRDKSQHVKMEARRRWIVEAFRGLKFLHEKDIMHGDVGCHNYLVDRNSHIKLCDFAGSMRKGETARICYEIRGRHPDYRNGEATPKTEIFALGSAIFEIYTSIAPYSTETNATVLKKFRNGVFPLEELRCPAIRDIVEKCWRSHYVQVSDISTKIEDIQETSFTTESS